mmetsp:Transcript_15132/g.52587  ORF Transcript_15132/g.52587 Transcript_15132/m.52587 type:complete len:285 (-) Transcript_15132:155-1009(-)
MSWYGLRAKPLQSKVVDEAGGAPCTYRRLNNLCRLGHLPYHQRKTVTSVVSEAQWLVHKREASNSQTVAAALVHLGQLFRCETVSCAQLGRHGPLVLHACKSENLLIHVQRAGELAKCGWGLEVLFVQDEPQVRRPTSRPLRCPALATALRRHPQHYTFAVLPVGRVGRRAVERREVRFDGCMHLPPGILVRLRWQQRRFRGGTTEPLAQEALEGGYGGLAAKPVHGVHPLMVQPAGQVCTPRERLPRAFGRGWRERQIGEADWLAVCVNLADDEVDVALLQYS